MQAFEELLEGAGRGVTCCCVCGADGTPSTSGGGSDDDSDGEGDASLYFTVLTGLSFKDRTVAMKRAGVSYDVVLAGAAHGTVSGNAC